MVRRVALANENDSGSFLNSVYGLWCNQYAQSPCPNPPYLPSPPLLRRGRGG
jgi:hypothetical protein